MNANKLWEILRSKDIKNVRDYGSLFYGSGAMVKRAGKSWRVIPCGASLFDPREHMEKARGTIRLALEEHKIEFIEREHDFLVS